VNLWPINDPPLPLKPAERAAYLCPFVFFCG
jgi:hypothetical protein